ncbi:MAG: hypothetical protein ABIT47_01980 [Candidatus Paceibacterota bacterium]
MTSRTRTWVKKIGAGVLSLTIVLGLSYGSFAVHEAPKAEAFLGVGDIVIDPTNLIQNTIGAAASVDSVVVSKILNGLAWTVAKLTIQSITRSTVNWINSGFNGSPAFVSDLQSNLKYLGDSVADDFFNQLNNTVVDSTGFNIRSPFQDQINQKLRSAYYRETSGALGLSAYDLSGHSTDPKAFLDGNFSQGGFNGFFSASQNPANNPFDAYKLASDQLWASIDVATKQRQSEIQNGQGFLSWRGECPTSPSAAPTTSVIDTPNAPATGGRAGALAAANNAVSTALGTKPVSLSKAEQCRNSPIRTPGSVIVGMMPKTLQSGLDSLQAADSINEVVGALMGQLVNKVLGSGGLSGASQPTSGGGSSYLDQATSPSQYDALTTSLANGWVQTLENDRTSLNNFQKQWGTIISAATQAQTSCGTRSEITTVLNQGNQELDKASRALSALNVQEDQVKSASASNAPNKSQVISNATISYQTYLSSPIISPTEFGEAFIQSQPTSASSSQTTLYTQMTNLASSCVAR